MQKLFSCKTIIATVLILLFTTACEKNPEKSKEAFIRMSVENINPDSLRSYVQWLQDMETRFALADNHRDIAVKIKNKFISLGYGDTRLDSFPFIYNYKNTEYNTWQYNVIATLSGNVMPDSICIIGAHYDSILSSGDPFSFAPGANDNASGVAAALEIARLMNKYSFRPGYTIKFVAFAAEELGLRGSSDFAGKAASAHDKVIMMINNDMIGNCTESPSSPWSINIISYPNSTSLGNNAALLCDKYTSLASFTDNSLNSRSDSYSFFLNGFKPLFFIQKSLDNNYHTVNDVTSACNFDFCREVVKISYALLLDKNYTSQ